MPDDDPGLVALEARRAGLYAALSRVGDFRRGALNAVWRKCGSRTAGAPSRASVVTGRSTT